MIYVSLFTVDESTYRWSFSRTRNNGKGRIEYVPSPPHFSERMQAVIVVIVDIDLRKEKHFHQRQFGDVGWGWDEEDAGRLVDFSRKVLPP